MALSGSAYKGLNRLATDWPVAAGLASSANESVVEGPPSSGALAWVMVSVVCVLAWLLLPSATVSVRSLNFLGVLGSVQEFDLLRNGLKVGRGDAVAGDLEVVDGQRTANGLAARETVGVRRRRRTSCRSRAR